MIMRVPLRAETVEAVQKVPTKLKALRPAAREVERAEMADMELSARLPELDDQDGFLMCRRFLRELISDNFGLGPGIVVDGEICWNAVAERAAAAKRGARLPDVDGRHIAVQVPDHVAEEAHRTAAERMGEIPQPLQEATRGGVGEQVTVRIRQAMRIGMQAYQGWAKALENWDGVRELAPVTLAVPLPVASSATTARWTMEKVLGSWIDGWVAEIRLPESKLLKDPLSVLVDGRVLLWVSLFWRAGKYQRREWTQEQERWIRERLREERRAALQTFGGS